MPGSDAHDASSAVPRLISRWTAIIFGVALLLRAMHLLGDMRSPFFEFHGIDALDYHRMAQGMLAGTWPQGQPFFWAPLYPLVLGMLYSVVGQASIVLKLMQAVMGAGSCVLVYRLGKRLFRSPRVAVVAGLATALNGTLIYFDGQLLSASLDVFLLLLALELLLSAAVGTNTRRWWAAGIVIGLSAVNRGGILLLLPLIVVWVFAILRLRWPIGRSGPRQPVAGKVLAGALAAVIVPSVITVGMTVAHNVHADGEASRGAMGLLPVASNMGVNFYLGNHWELREINKTNHPRHFSHYDDILNLPAAAGVTGVFASSQYLFRQTLRDIANNPMAFARLMGVKSRELIHGREIPRNGNLYANRTQSPVLAALMWKHVVAFPAGLVIPLGLVGMALALRTWRGHFLPIAAVVTHAAFVLMFFVTARYRLPAMPLLTLYGSAAIVAALHAVRAGAWRPVFAFGLCALALGVITNWRVEPGNPEHAYYEYCLLAQVHDQAGALDDAIANYRKGLALNPDYAWGHLHLARALMKRGDWEEAEAHFRRGIALEPNSPNAPPAHVGRGRALARLGRLREAVRAWETALALNPDLAVAHMELCRALPRIGHTRDAAAHCELADRIAATLDDGQ